MEQIRHLRAAPPGRKRAATIVKAKRAPSKEERHNVTLFVSAVLDRGSRPRTGSLVHRKSMHRWEQHVRSSMSVTRPRGIKAETALWPTTLHALAHYLSLLTGAGHGLPVLALAAGRSTSRFRNRSRLEASFKFHTRPRYKSSCKALTVWKRFRAA